MSSDSPEPEAATPPDAATEAVSAPTPAERARALATARYPDLVARAVFYFGLVGLAGLAIWSVRSTLTVLLLAFFFAYLLDPIVEALQRRGLKRGVAIGAMVGGGTLGIALVLALLLPFISADLRELAHRLPQRLEALAQFAPGFIERTFGIRPPDDLAAWLTERAQEAKDSLPGLAGTLGKHLAEAARGAASALGMLVSVALVPLFAFYLLRDFTGTKRRLLDELVPSRHHEAVAERLDRIDDALGGFVRGQLTVCACLAVVYTTGLLIGRVPLAFVVGPLAGLCSLVPFLGVGVFLVLGMLAAALEASGLGPIVAVGVTLLVAQALEGLVLTPRIVGSRVGLSAFGVLLSIATFNELMGFVGILLAVPLGATLKILLPDVRRLWRRSRLFAGE